MPIVATVVVAVLVARSAGVLVAVLVAVLAALLAAVMVAVVSRVQCQSWRQAAVFCGIGGHIVGLVCFWVLNRYSSSIVFQAG